MIDVSQETLNDGANTLVFRSSKGSYNVEQIRLNFDLKVTKSVVYYFEIDENHFANITTNKNDVTLSMRFVDDKESKVADISVNGHKFRLDQTKSVFTRNINSMVEQGNNFIEIVPKDTLHLVALNVTMSMG